jgi:hypothetical protein
MNSRPEPQTVTVTGTRAPVNKPFVARLLRLRLNGFEPALHGLLESQPIWGDREHRIALDNQWLQAQNIHNPNLAAPLLADKLVSAGTRASDATQLPSTRPSCARAARSCYAVESAHSMLQIASSKRVDCLRRPPARN